MKKRPCILFVDDNVDTRYVVEMWLGMSGYEAVTTSRVG